MNLCTLLKMGKDEAITYDFKNEIIYDYEKIKHLDDENCFSCICNTLEKEENNIKRFSLYRKYNALKTLRGWKIFDCDSSNGSCKLTNDIYDKLWGWYYGKKGSDGKPLKRQPSCHLREKLSPKWDDFELGSDTMNSFQTTGKEAIKIYKKKHNCTQIEAVSYASKNENLQEFARLTHSIGNFTLIPHLRKSGEYKNGFNAGRYAQTKDYWDLSLELLQEALGDEEFNKYVDTFFMRDFYLCGDNKIKKFFTGHSKENLFPRDESELNEFLVNVNKKIKCRGKKMFQALKCTINS